MNLISLYRILTEHNLTDSPCPAEDLPIHAISCNSKQVLPGTLFFCKGVQFKEAYLQEAIRRGAVAYIAEKPYNVMIPYLHTNQIRLAMPLLAHAFYDGPETRYPLVGITGTKGKTTCAYMLYNIWKAAYGENECAIISTNEARCGAESIPKSGTTPEALDLYAILNRFAQLNAKGTVMEVSSQALQYNRIEYLDFAVGIFLNLSEDHISPTEHHSFAEYKSAKQRMLTLCRNGIVNLDDPYAPDMIEAATCEKLYTVSVTQPADFRAEDILLTKRGASFRVNGELYEITMPGEFNLYNALCAIAAATLTGIPTEAIRIGLKQTQIAGRLEILEQNGITVIVDYAHNGKSFTALFDYVDHFYPDAKKICLFGCQGNKALDRRQDLPVVAGTRADTVILTSDDPADEEPRAIMEEVELLLKRGTATYEMEEDREKAVHRALEQAKTGDVVMLLGKGSETTQIVAGGKKEFYKGDLVCAKEALAKKAAEVY